MHTSKGPKHLLIPVACAVVLCLMWQAAVMFGAIPNYLVPAPLQVIGALVSDWQLLLMHATTTLIEALLGLAIGCILGLVLATLMERFPAFYAATEPLMTISQTIPTVAIAPLLVLWFGYGILPKVLLVVLTTFFPITVSLVSGFKSVRSSTLDLFKVMGASWWQTFRIAKFPAALDQFFAGLKISVTYAVVAAVVSEWLGGNSGLGVFMTRVRKSFAYDRMFASIILISALSLILMWIFSRIQTHAMPWRTKDIHHES